MTAPNAVTPVTCTACQGVGRIPDKTGGGHHGTCGECGGLGVLLTPTQCAQAHRQRMRALVYAATRYRDAYTAPVADPGDDMLEVRSALRDELFAAVERVVS